MILFAEEGVGYPEGAYERLSGVTATVGLEFPWRVFATSVADTIGARERLEELLGERDRRVAELAELARGLGPVATLRVSDATGVRTPATALAAELVHDDLGIPALDGLGGPELTDLAAEQFGALADAESLLIGVDPEAPADTLEKLQANPLWAGLPAVRAGRVYTTSRLLLDPDSLPQQAAALDFVEENLLSGSSSPTTSPTPTG